MTDLWQSGYFKCNNKLGVYAKPFVWKQSHALIQQSSACADTWLGAFCSRSCQNQLTGMAGWHALRPCNQKQDNLWWLDYLIAWKYSAALCEVEGLLPELGLWQSQVVLAWFSLEYCCFGDQKFIMWITLDTMRFQKGWMHCRIPNSVHFRCT